MRVDGLLFTLTNAENSDQVVAWGMEITFGDPAAGSERSVAVVYRHDPVSGRETHSWHGSAEGARAAYDRSLPIDVELIWHGADVPVSP